MKSIILTKNNKDELILKLNDVSNGRKYWIGVATGRIESVEDPSHTWFKGVGTFERIVYLRFKENKHGHGIQIDHINAVSEVPVIPDDDTIRYGSEIMFDDGDVFYYEDNSRISPRGGTNLYMEYSKERYEKYLR